MTGQPQPPDLPPRARAALAVFAHPDDETFGLGAVLSALVDTGTVVEGLCFTRGEAWTFGPDPASRDVAGDLGDLGDVRAAELADAARLLGLDHCELLAYPDGRLAETPVAILASHVLTAALRRPADLLVVFDHGGVTGHPDHPRRGRPRGPARHRRARLGGAATRRLRAQHRARHRLPGSPRGRGRPHDRR